MRTPSSPVVRLLFPVPLCGSSTRSDAHGRSHRLKRWRGRRPSSSAPREFGPRVMGWQRVGGAPPDLRIIRVRNPLIPSRSSRPGRPHTYPWEPAERRSTNWTAAISGTPSSLRRSPCKWVGGSAGTVQRRRWPGPVRLRDRKGLRDRHRTECALRSRPVLAPPSRRVPGDPRATGCRASRRDLRPVRNRASTTRWTSTQARG